MTRKQLIKNGLKYQFKNEIKGDKHILTLSGVVAKPDFWDMIMDNKTINSADITKALDDVDKDIHIKLNSGGGDAFEGIEIYNYLKNHPSHVTIEITSLAASAASIIAMSADELIMDTGTSMMIHQASTFAWGDKSELSKTMNALETIDDSLIDIYKERTGKDYEVLSEYLAKETWFTADEAVSEGFADKKSSKQAVTPQVVEPEEDDVESPEMQNVLNLLKEQSEKISAMTNQMKTIQNQEPKRRLYF